MTMMTISMLMPDMMITTPMLESMNLFLNVVGRRSWVPCMCFTLLGEFICAMAAVALLVLFPGNLHLSQAIYSE
jgi:hypothetical protein